MAAPQHIILGIHVTDRVHHVRAVQDVLTTYGCNIRTRLGLHNASEDHCSPNGLLILELTGGPDIADSLQNELAVIEGIDVQRMTFFGD